MAQKQTKRTTTQQLINAANKGLVADFVGGPVDLATMLLNAPGQIYGAVKGQAAPYEIKKPVGGSEWIGGLLDEAGITYDDGENTSLLEDAARLGFGVVGPAGVLKGAQAAPRVAKTVGQKAMAAGKAGERYAEKVVPQIMERGGPMAGLLQDMAQGSRSQIFIGPEAKTWRKTDASKAASTKILSRLAKLLRSNEEASYKALREAQPTYTNVESATKAGEGMAERGLPVRGEYPGTAAAHEKAVRGTVADLSRPEVMPSIGSWTEEGVNYVNPGSSVNLGRGIREFGGYGGPIPAELAQAAGALQQTGAGMSRFTPGRYNRPQGFFSDVEFKTQPTQESMRKALAALTPAERYAVGGNMPDALYARFLQHVPQEGVVRGHNMAPEDVRFLQEIFGSKPRYGRADTVYNEGYPLDPIHRGLLQD